MIVAHLYLHYLIQGGFKHYYFPLTSFSKFFANFLNSLNKPKQEVDLSIYKAGQRIYHKKFGEGTINYVEEEGEDAKVDINFDKVGHKRLMAKYAGLEIIE